STRSLLHVVPDVCSRALQRRAVATAATRAQPERVSRLHPRGQDLRVREVAFPHTVGSERHLVARRLETAVEAPWQAVRAFHLRPPWSPIGTQCARSTCASIVRPAGARPTRPSPSPPRWRPAPPESGTSA